MSHAFEVTPQDVENVLRANIAKIGNSHGLTLEALAEDIFDDWTEDEFYCIESAALNGGNELEEQTDAAYAEIHRILVDEGILKQ